MNADVRVTIVGRGAAGLACAVALADTGRITPGEITAVDPVDGWLGAFTDRLDRLGVTHLRSSTFQHPAPDGRALERYLHTSADPETDGFLRYPPVRLFRRFCDHLVATTLTGATERRAVVAAIREVSHGFTVVTGDGYAWSSRSVVLATHTRVRRVPAWAVGLAPDSVVHADDLRLDRQLDGGGPIAVIGGGNTAAGLAVAAAERDIETVLLARRPLRGQRFDVAPGWMSATYVTAYARIRDPVARLHLAGGAARGGTVPPRLLDRLQKLAAGGALDVREGVRVAAVRRTRGGWRLDLSDGTYRVVARIWLATGGRPMLADRPVISLRRPMAFLGRYPLLDDNLRIPATGLFVIGALARVAVGPTAGNLHGHRRAAARIASAVA